MQLRTIRTKLLGLMVGTAALALTAACISFVAYDRSSFAESKQSAATILADAVAGSLAGPVAFGDADSAARVLQSLGAEATAEAAVILNESGVLASWKAETSEAGDLDGARYFSPGYHPSVMLASDLVLEVPISDEEGNPIGQLRMKLSAADIDARSYQFLRIAVIVLVGCVLGAGLGASFLHRIISSPVKRLADAAQTVRSEHDYTVRVEKTTADELGALTEGFNAMLADIESRDAELEEHRLNLAAKVEERTAELSHRNAAMRLVLDNVEQGFLTIDRELKMAAERSAIVDQWFQPPTGDQDFAAYVFDDPMRQSWFRLGWDELLEGIMPAEVVLAQLPNQTQRGEQSFRVEYQAITGAQDAAEVEKVLVVITDITMELRQAQMEREQKEFIAVFEKIMKDRRGFMEYYEDASTLVRRISEGATSDPTVVKREVHTLKGNSGMFGIQRLVETCHEVETRLDTEGGLPSAEERNAIACEWEQLTGRLSHLIKDQDIIELTLPQYERLLAEASEAKSVEQVVDQLERLRHEPADQRLERIAEQARTLARRLDKGTIDVHIESNDVRLEPHHWAPFWSAFVHVVRNAVDHGLESKSDRQAAGKPRPKLVLRTAEEDGHCRVEISDNGRGIDWDAIARKAHGLGIPSETMEDLKNALFTDGLSTRQEVSETSGRGVGMAAVRAVCEGLGGHIQVDSQRGEGTTFVFTVPLTTDEVAATQELP